jgi:hypothetical protein
MMLGEVEFANETMRNLETCFPEIYSIEGCHATAAMEIGEERESENPYHELQLWAQVEYLDI